MNTVTLKDIAALANCSVNTVSLALKNSPRLSEATRLRIQEIAREQNYVSNNMARALVLGQTKTIGLVLRNISSLLLTTEARYIEKYLEKRGYTMYVIASHDDSEMERKAIDLMVSNRVDGMLVNTKSTDNLPRLEALRRQGLPIVLLSGFEQPPAVDSIFPDLSRGAYLATKHLLEQGRRNIRFVLGGRSTSACDPLKYQGFQLALQEYGIPCSHEQLCSVCLPQKGGAEEGFSELLDVVRQGDTGLFVNADEFAIPLIKAFYQHGVRVPQDAAVVSMDNISFAESALVSLTTVGYDLEFISQRAVDMLLEMVKGGGDLSERPCQSIHVEPKLYVRESCGNLSL